MKLLDENRILFQERQKIKKCDFTRQKNVPY